MVTNNIDFGENITSIVHHRWLSPNHQLQPTSNYSELFRQMRCSIGLLIPFFGSNDELIYKSMKVQKLHFWVLIYGIIMMHQNGIFGIRYYFQFSSIVSSLNIGSDLTWMKVNTVMTDAGIHRCLYTFMYYKSMTTWT